MLGKHLLGLYEKALPDDMSLPEKFGSAADMGFDYLEISVDESDKRISRLWLPEEELDALAAGIRRSGLYARSLCLSAHRRFPLGSADARTRRAALEIMRRAIRFSEALGIRMIQLAGYDVYYEPSTEESRRLFVCGLHEACREAEAHQVMLAMEIMDTELLCSISRFMKLKRGSEIAVVHGLPGYGEPLGVGQERRPQGAEPGHRRDHRHACQGGPA